MNEEEIIKEGKYEGITLWGGDYNKKGHKIIGRLKIKGNLYLIEDESKKSYGFEIVEKETVKRLEEESAK